MEITDGTAKKETSQENSGSNAKETPIQNTYSFWFMKRSPSNKSESYEKSIKHIGSFQTVEGFWGLYSFMIRPCDLPNTTDYHLFKTGIKPMWEDPANRRGGKWMVRLKKGIASRLWEELLLAIIGEQFDVGNEVCGAVLSIRYNEDIISLWNRNADNEEACYKLRDTIRRAFRLPQFVSLEYKRHDTSLIDNSSFRNTTVWRSGSRSGGNRNTSNSSKDRETHGTRDSNSREGVNNSNSGKYSRDRDSTQREWNRGQWTRDRNTREKNTNNSNRQETADGEEPWQFQR